MRLVSKQRFSEFFQDKVKKEHHRNLMMKMMALEVKLLITSMRFWSCSNLSNLFCVMKRLSTQIFEGNFE